MYVALCSCVQLVSLIVMARSTTYESAKVSLATFMCDVDECTFEGNCSKSLKRHKLTHSAALLHCDFMGCSFETKYSSNLKRHELSHTTKVTAEPKKQRLSNQIPIQESFGGSRSASIDAGLQKASAFFSSPNETRTTCACCNELQKTKNIKVIKAEGQWLELLKNRLTWNHTAHVVCDLTRAYYHAPEAALDLKGIPLAPSGIQIILTSPEDACVNEPNDTDHVIATKNVNVTVHVSLLLGINALKKLKFQMQ